MHGVTTAIVAFLLVCIIWPHIVKNRTAYYTALAVVLVIILLDGLAKMNPDASSFRGFVYAISSLLQIVALVGIIMSAGGPGAGELASNMTEAMQALRRGEMGTVEDTSPPKPVQPPANVVVRSPEPPPGPLSVE